jgi:hypothetical protein
MTKPAAGTANKLHGVATAGIPPASAIKTGAVAACAAKVTASGKRNQPGPGSRSARGRANNNNPAVAQIDN